MNRTLWLACVVVLSATPLTWAQSGDGSDLTTYLQQLQLKLDHTAQRANQPSSGASSVVGVRGAAQEPLSKQLYWKGKKSQQLVSLDEVKALRSAVEQASNGQKTEAIASLKAFEQQYPTSALKPDAEETLRRLGDVPAVPAKS